MDIEKRLLRIEAMLEVLMAGLPSLAVHSQSDIDQLKTCEAQGIDIVDFLQEKHRLNKAKKREERRNAKINRRTCIK